VSKIIIQIVAGGILYGWYAVISIIGGIQTVGWCMGMALAEWHNKVSGMALTLCRAQDEEAMRGAINCQQVMRTHFLLRAERGSCEGSKLMPVSEGYSPPVESRAEESLGQQDKSVSEGRSQYVEQRARRSSVE
jgi:hypothetical protein